jgi:hypothetical protein
MIKRLLEQNLLEDLDFKKRLTIGEIRNKQK